MQYCLSILKAKDPPVTFPYLQGSHGFVYKWAFTTFLEVTSEPLLRIAQTKYISCHRIICLSYW